MCTGPYTVSRVININGYKFDLMNTMHNQNIFHVSRLDRSAPPVTREPPSEPPATIVEDAGAQEWEVERILDGKLYYQKLYYFVHRVGYSHIPTSWEPAENVENSQEMVDEFHQTHWRNPLRK